MGSQALQALFPESEKIERAAATSSNGAPSWVKGRDRDQFLACLTRMSPRQRIEAYRRGQFNRHERALWACRYPDEVPIVNDEFEWLVLGSADLD